MSVDNYVAAEILATCNALGSEIRGAYEKSSDCLNCLKDLILYLKRDDEEHTVRRQLGELRLIQTDLVPLLKSFSKDEDIFNMTLRLLVILTHPAFLLYQEEVPEDKVALNIYLSIVSHLQSSKKAFIDVGVWKVLSESLKELLSVSYADRDEDGRLTVERILILIRNVMHVPPDDTEEKRTDDDVSIHDQVLWSLHLARLEDLLLYLAQNEEEHQYCFHVLEIISLILRHQTPEILATAGHQRSLAEKDDDERKLNSARRMEYLARLERGKKLSVKRFDGVYYVKNMKSISDREHISHALLSNLDDVKFGAGKAAKRTPKNRLPVSDVDVHRRSALSICLFLKDICSYFINNCYNIMMSSVKRMLLNKKLDDHDDSYYLWAMSYFMEFNRRSDFQLAVISETVSVQIFHYVQTQIDNYRDMMMADKKKVRYWSRRIHLGLKAYKEMLETLQMMDSSSDENIKRCAEVIKSNVFYVVEYRELLLSLIMNYDELRFSLSYLTDLVQTIFLFFKMLEQYSKVHSKVIVQAKKKRQRRRKGKKLSGERSAVMQTNLEELWHDTISSDLSAVLQGRKSIPDDVVPFDATSEMSFDEQKEQVSNKIQKMLVSNQCGEAVALLRAARELWPDDVSLGAVNIGPEDEFMILHEIFFATPPVIMDEPAEMEENLADEEENDGENFDDVALMSLSEQQFDVSEFFKRFASPKVVQPFCRLLANYKSNSLTTNKCLLKLIHHIAWEYKMHALFYQAQVFLTFRKILSDPDRNHDSVVKELARFSKFVLGKFFETAKENKKVFVEILFWKGAKDAYAIDQGYDAFKKPLLCVWTEEEEQELKELFSTYNECRFDGKDLGDVIGENMQKQRTRKEIGLKLKELGFIKGIKDLKPHKIHRKSDD